MPATTVAVDVAKTVFEIACANAQWHIVARQRLNLGILVHTEHDRVIRRMRISSACHYIEFTVYRFL
jgi:hypothetical protein